ncbi:unnamed protein product [Lymnaea stagnalis]|uniref:Uncharacterized protein n=1 Tax=Lymnaea stagnalis TaxID=6523 RepID=A0AAV2GY42_LYMST
MATKAHTNEPTEIEPDAQCEPYPRDTKNPEIVDAGQFSRPFKAKNSSMCHKLPQSLREDYFEILIISAEADLKQAEDCRQFLRKELNCRIELLGIGVAPVNHLEACLEKTMYTFIYVTKRLCECTWSTLLSQVSLKKTLEDNDKKWTVIPLHTQSQRDYVLPLLLRYLEPIINFWQDDHDLGRISGLLKKKKAEIDQREFILDEERSKWLTENCQLSKKEHRLCTSNLDNETLADQNTSLIGGGKPIKAEPLKALRGEFGDMALSSRQHVGRRERKDQPGAGHPGAGQTGTCQPGTDQPGPGHSEAGQPEARQPEAGQPEAGQPGPSQPGPSQLGSSQPEEDQFGPSQAGADRDISVDSGDPVDSGVFSVSNRSVACQSNHGAAIITSNTPINVNMLPAETASLGEPSKYVIPGPEETDSE